MLNDWIDSVSGVVSDGVTSSVPDIIIASDGVISEKLDRLYSYITSDAVHPFMTTDFEKYTVIEGLLLFLLLALFIWFCLWLVKKGFAWLS